MALVPCHECGNNISDQAKTCPQCGVAPIKPKKSKAWLYVLIGAPVIFLVWALVRTPSPEETTRYNEREAIAFCWEDQKSKSYEPSTARFVASACEKMERDFRKKHGLNP